MISNTVKFGFPPGSPRPSWVEIADFLKHLNSDPSNMETVYKMGTDRSLYIKYRSEAAMQDALQRNKDSVKFHYSNGKSVELRMLTAGVDVQYVRVFDVAPEIDDKDLSAVFGKYGDIHRTVREKFPVGLGLDHLYTGVRGIYMEIKNEIPSALDVGQWKAKIYYEGFKEKCFLCRSEGHFRKSCPKLKTTEKRGQKIKTQSVTYAGVVQAGATAPPNDTDTLDEDIIEIVGEEILESQMQTEAEQLMESTPKVTEIKIDEMEEEIDQVAEQLGLENFRENIAKLSDMIDALPNNNNKDQASQRRAQFASSGSTELRPKKSARKSNK